MNQKVYELTCSSAKCNTMASVPVQRDLDAAEVFRGLGWHENAKTKRWTCPKHSPKAGK